MITAIRGDLTKVEGVEFICNAANGIGPMGSGIAGAIRRAGGTSIQDEAFVVCNKTNYQPGDIYVTNAGTLPYKKIIHLVTMKLPGGDTSYEIVEKCLDSLISFCKLRDIDKVALPALGTGVGNLSLEKVADIFKEKLESIEDIEFVVVDINPLFIYQFNKET